MCTAVYVSEDVIRTDVFLAVRADEQPLRQRMTRHIKSHCGLHASLSFPYLSLKLTSICIASFLLQVLYRKRPDDKWRR